MSAYVYMVRCKDGTLYTGWTVDVVARVAAHNAGKGAKYTKARLPVTLVYTEECRDKQAAMQREWAIKQMSREEKMAMIAGYSPERFKRLFLAFGKATLHFRQHGIMGFSVPSIGETYFDELLTKYCQLYMDGVNPEYTSMQMEKDKMLFPFKEEEEITLLLVIQTCIGYVMQGDMEEIMAFSRYFTGTDVYDELIRMTRQAGVVLWPDTE